MRKSKTIKIRVVSKAKNSILAQFADDCGGVKYAAKKIGIAPATYSNWMNLRSVPGLTQFGTLTKRTRDPLLKLAQETGKDLKDIFPLTKKQLEPLAKARTQEHVIERDSIENYAREKSKLMTEQSVSVENMDQSIDAVAIREEVGEMLHILSHREREIIKLHYGLGDGYSYTLEEVGHIFKVTPGRIRQIEAKAIRKIQMHPKSKSLAEHL